VLIVQNDIGNKHSPTLIIIPLTSSNKGHLPTHVRISRTGGLVSDSIALCEQPRTIDKSRLDGYLGRIDDDTLETVSGALSVSMKLAPGPGRPPKENVLVLSLCYRCKCEFEDSGRVLVKRGWQEYKEPCDRCQFGMGLNYAVFEKKDRRACA